MLDEALLMLGVVCNLTFGIACALGIVTTVDQQLVTYFPDAACSNGDIRLVDGLISTEGRVEVCMNGGWTGICDSSWNYQDAFVVCRQLGYPATGMSHCTSISAM